MSDGNIRRTSTSCILPQLSCHSTSTTVTLSSSTLPSLNIQEPFGDESRPSSVDEALLYTNNSNNKAPHNSELDDKQWNNLQFNMEIEI